jgi:hypothetical protein
LRQSYIVIVWLVLAACLVLVFFIAPQIGLHLAMAREKRDKRHALSAHLSAMLDDVISDPDPDRADGVGKFINLDSYLHGMPEWPFDAKALVSVVSAVVLPLVLALLQKLLLE